MKKLCTVALFLAFAFAAIADPVSLPCNSGLTTLPEGSLETEVSMSCPGYAFGANAGVAVLMEPDGVTPSDIVTFSDVAGVATVGFFSDLDLPIALPSSPFTTIEEPGTFVALAASTTDGTNGTLGFAVGSDVNESLTTSDFIRVGTPSEVPEPATYLLLGTIVFFLAAYKFRTRVSG